MGLVAILSAGFLDLLSVTIANVALPTIAVRLPATPAQAQGILTAYTVTFAVGLITAPGSAASWDCGGRSSWAPSGSRRRRCCAVSVDQRSC